MDQEEIISKLISYLNQHLTGTRGDFSQEPYRSDFFALFKIAYERNYFAPSSNPRFTGDSLREIVAERWCSDEEDKNEERIELMDILFTKWDEWKYAWEKFENE